MGGGIFSVAILDYTPLYIRRYKEDITRQLMASTIREAMPEKSIVSTDYIRGLHSDIPDKKYDMILITGSILSTAYPSEDLDRALKQIESVIWDTPTLGICFGLHAIAQITGNHSKMIEEFEIGAKEAMLYNDIHGVGKAGETILLPVNHNYKISNSNGNLMVLAMSNGGIQIADASQNFYGNPVFGIQAHPEFAVTPQGWKIFRKIYYDTIKEVVSGEFQGVSLQPILNAIGKEQFNRFMESVNDNPDAVIGVGLSERQLNLLMSPFHNIDHRQKLLGKKESERTYMELREKSRGLMTNFLHRALKKKELKKPKPKVVPIKKDVKPGTQMKLKL